MTGNYGSEVLRLSRAFRPVSHPPGLFSADLAPYIDAANATYADNSACHPVSFAVFRQAPWHHYGLLSLEQTQLCLRSPYLDNDLVQTVFRKPPSVSDDAVCLRLIADGNPTLLRIRTDRGLGGCSRPPSARLRRLVLEFLFKAEYGYDEGMPQWLARLDGALAPLRLERLFLGTHKFHHFRVWYRNELSEYVRAILLDPRTLSRPFLKRDAVERMVAGHLQGKRNYTSAIHRLLALELLHRLFIDQAPPQAKHSKVPTKVLHSLQLGSVQHGW
jgi:asparagine synthase (glutamine-hydrolysing)